MGDPQNRRAGLDRARPPSRTFIWVLLILAARPPVGDSVTRPHSNSLVRQAVALWDRRPGCNVGSRAPPTQPTIRQCSSHLGTLSWRYRFSEYPNTGSERW